MDVETESKGADGQNRHTHARFGLGEYLVSFHRLGEPKGLPCVCVSDDACKRATGRDVMRLPHLCSFSLSYKISDTSRDCLVNFSVAAAVVSEWSVDRQLAKPTAPRESNRQRGIPS